MKNKLLFILIVLIFSSSLRAGNIFVTNTNESGSGSFRNAVSLANINDSIIFDQNLISSGNDTIFLESVIKIDIPLYIKGVYNNTDTLFISGKSKTKILEVSIPSTTFGTFILDSMVFVDAYNNQIIIGGAVSFLGSDITINNCIFRNNTTNNNGGALLIECFGLDTANISIENSLFHNNIAQVDGGAFCLISDSTPINLSIKNSSFFNNESGNDGGGIHVNAKKSNINISLFKIVCDYNVAINGGGGYLSSNKKLQLLVDSSIFNRNDIMTGNGGGLFVSSNDSLKIFIYNSVMDSNVTSNDVKGGGLYINCNSEMLVEIERNVFKRNYAQYGGGFYIEHVGLGNVKISNCDLIDNWSANSGGGGNINTTHSEHSFLVDLDSLTFIENRVTGSSGSGGGLFVNKATVELNESLFEKNYGRTSGGGLFIIGDFKIEKTTFSKNSSNGNGGGFLVTESKNTSNILNCYIDSNTSNGNGGGGAISCRYHETIIDSCTFSNNQSSAGGGVEIRSLTGSKLFVNVKNTAFIQNSSNISGGGIKITSHSSNDVNLKNLFVLGNIGGSIGGGILVQSSLRDSKVDIYNSIIDSNSANEGGGISISNVNNSIEKEVLVNIDKCKVRYNTAFTRKGGGIYIYGEEKEELNITNSEVKFNYAQDDGGGIYLGLLISSFVNLENSEITNNISYGDGGGIHSFNTELINSLISGNKAYDGGGVKTKNIICHKTIFSNNIATNSGGGIMSEANFDFYNIQESIFKNNQSEDGGAIWSSLQNGDTIRIDKSTFSDNNVNNDGGAIYAIGNHNGFIEINKSTFNRNTSNHHGGAFYIKGNLVYPIKLNLNYSTVSGNVAFGGGGVFYDNFSTSQSYIYPGTYIKSSILALNEPNNLLNTDSTRYISLGHNIIGDSNIVGYGTTDIINNDSSSINLGQLNKNGGFTKTMMPLAGSIAINKGDTSDITDAQNWSITDNYRDIGAAENVCIYQVIDTISQCNEYVSHTGRFTWDTSGTYTDTVFGIGVCDTLFVVDYTWNGNKTKEYYSSCDSFQIPNSSKVMYITGIINDTLINSLGCDSIIEYNVTIHQPSYGVDIVQACDSFVWINEVTYHSNNNLAKDTLTSSYGCDSIVTLNLTISQPSFSSDTVITCDSYTSPTGRILINSGIYHDTLINNKGCDSIITISLTIKLQTFSSVSATACFSYEAPSGAIYTSSGIYTDILTNHAGCDSIITINLSLVSIDTSINETNGIFQANETNGTYQWLNCDSGYSEVVGETFQFFTPTPNISYALEILKNGCLDTSYCQSVQLSNINEKELEIKDFIYPNPTNGLFYIKLDNSIEITSVKITNIDGMLIKEVTYKKQNVIPVYLNGKSGVYFIELLDNKGFRKYKLIKL